MFENKASAFSALKTLVTTYGAAVTLTLLDDGITARAKINAYGRGRRTLEQQPWIATRECCRVIKKEVTDRKERKESGDVKVTADDRKIVTKLLEQFGADDVCGMVAKQFAKQVDMSEYVELCKEHIARLHDRRAKFFPSDTAVNLGVVTIVPEREATR